MLAPLIGVTLDSEEPSGLSRIARYRLSANYTNAVAAAGGLAIGLPHAEDQVEAYADRIDGLIVTGGAFDIDPSLFGVNTKHETVRTKAARTAFELAVTKAVMKRNKPVLGICGGQQLLNVVLGGTLIQHIEAEVADSLLHEQPNPRHEPGHAVKVTPGSLLHKICGAAEMHVNSAHHQAVKTVGPGVVVNAVARDGIIEGIEDPRLKFCIGVQWHPEFGVDQGDRRLFKALIEAAQTR